MTRGLFAHQLFNKLRRRGEIVGIEAPDHRHGAHPIAGLEEIQETSLLLLSAELFEIVEIV